MGACWEITVWRRSIDPDAIQIHGLTMGENIGARLPSRRGGNRFSGTCAVPGTGLAVAGGSPRMAKAWFTASIRALRLGRASGYSVGGRAFGPGVISRNITP